ncbi:MAG: flavin reductase family protein [Nanoarchaeota archaeon]|nr:flavin reductase family protein [Nanoarchaeota archaeon]
MLNIVNPRQTVLVTCRADVKNFGKQGVKDNIIAIDWHTPLAFNPMMYAISVGKERFSCELIKASGVFVVNFMSNANEKEVLFCGRNTGRHIDKFEATELTRDEADKVDCCKINEALAYMECEVTETIETGDHVLFIANVLGSEVRKSGKRLYHTNGNEFTTTLE